MGESADRIEERIQQQRLELQQNVRELQRKAARAVNWRAQFDQRPMTMIGVAFGGGVLLSVLMGGRRPTAPRMSSSYDTPTSSAARTTSPPDQGRAPGHTWERLQGALLGVAAARLGTAVESWLPGFQESYDNTGRSQGRTR